MNVEDILNKYSNGYSLEKIAKEYNTHRHKIKKILIENGLVINSKPQEKFIEKDVLENLISLGLPNKQICKKLNCSESFLNKYIKKYNLYREKPPVPPKEELLKHYDSGMSMVDISKIYNVSNVTVKNWFSKYGIKIKSISEILSFKNVKTHYDESVCVDYINNISKEEICKKYNISSNTYHKIISRNNLDIRDYKKILSDKMNNRSHLKCVDFSDIDLLYEENSLNDLSKIYNCARDSIKNRIASQPRTRSEAAKLALPKSIETKKEKYGYSHFPDTIVKESKSEIELRDFLNSFGYNFKSCRNILDNGLELDGYDDNIKTAFEYCGLYWHSELYKQPNYHYNKFKDCEEKGIRLFTIFESDDILKIKNFILSSIGYYEKNYFARKCRVEKISNHIAKQFLNTYHIQKSPPNIENAFGLYCTDNNLLAVMSFGKHHRNFSGTVLNRLCFLPNVSVSGGSEKLFKFAVNYLKTDILSWSDNRFSNGNVYKRLGFNLIKIYRQDYSYTDFKTIYSKQSQMKKKTKCPENMTEHQWANKNGLYRIYDCGKKSWLFTYK